MLPIGTGSELDASGRHVGYAIMDAVPVHSDDAAWDGKWEAKVKTDRDAFRAELAIPWQTLEAAGLRRDGLEVEVARIGPWGGPQDTLLRAFDRSAVQVHALDQPPAPGRYIVRLHFAELDDVRPGERVFDVLLQGEVVLKDFDVAREAGRWRAVVREFDVAADRQIDVRFVPKAAAPTERSVPILSGVELIRQ